MALLSRFTAIVRACVSYFVARVRFFAVLLKRDAPSSSPPALWAPAEGSLVQGGALIMFSFVFVFTVLSPLGGTIGGAVSTVAYLI